MLINLYQALKNFPALSRQLNCKGMLFTNYDCPQSMKKQKFFVECNYIAYVISGRRVFHKNEQSWELNEGVCVFVKKGTHLAEKEEDEGWCVMVFFIPDHFFKQLIDENRNTLPQPNHSEGSEDHVLNLHVNELSRSFFISMMPYFIQTPPPSETLVELKFKELVLSLLNDEGNRHFLAYLKNLDKQRPSMEEIMQKNFTSNLTLADYAKLLCKSVPVFKREFKKTFNDTPANWVMKRRISMAAQLLKNTTTSVTDIGFECGFENQTHFSRVFRQKMGRSPLQFRMHGQAPLSEGAVGAHTF
jgi:AraC family transcriptional regulator, exoenzyme S synthesis regulatory protein ExsA